MRARYLVIYILCCVYLILFLYTLSLPQDQTYHRDVEHYFATGDYGKVLFNVTWCYFNTTDILNATMNDYWNNETVIVTKPVLGAGVDLYGINLTKISHVETDAQGLAEVNATKLNLDGDYYIKVSVTVHFVEGGKETYFFWYIFSCSQNSEKEHIQHVQLRHALWEESPSNVVVNKG